MPDFSDWMSSCKTKDNKLLPSYVNWSERDPVLTLPLSTFLLFQNNVLPSGDKVIEGDKLVIQDVTRHHSGIYLCTGDNKVGRPDTAQIDLKVLCKPIFDFKKQIYFHLFMDLCIFRFRSSRDWSDSHLGETEWRHRGWGFLQRPCWTETWGNIASPFFTRKERKKFTYWSGQV